MPDHPHEWRHLRRGPRARLSEQRLEVPEHALIAALLRQAFADLQARRPEVRFEARAWFARGHHHYWLNLVGLPESSLDPALHGKEAPDA